MDLNFTQAFVQARDAFTHATGLDQINASSIGAATGDYLKNTVHPPQTTVAPQSARDMSSGVIHALSTSTGIKFTMPMLIGLGVVAYFMLKGRR